MFEDGFRSDNSQNIQLSLFKTIVGTFFSVHIFSFYFFPLQGAFFGIVVTHVIGVIRLICEIVYPVPQCGEPDDRPVLLSKIHSFYFSQMMMLTQVILVVAISYLTKPRTKEEVRINQQNDADTSDFSCRNKLLN